MNEFRERQLQRDRGRSPKQVLEEILQDIEEVDDLLIVFTDRDENIDLRFSCDNTLEILGMMEVAKSDTLRIMYGEHSQ